MKAVATTYSEKKEAINPSSSDAYLNDPREDLAMLKEYDAVRKFYCAYNGTPASSGPVERLFSSAALAFTARRAAMTDSLFEMLTLLKLNQK